MSPHPTPNKPYGEKHTPVGLRMDSEGSVTNGAFFEGRAHHINIKAFPHCDKGTENRNRGVMSVKPTKKTP